MAVINQSKVNKEFCNLLNENIKEYCDISKREVTPETIIEYLVTHNVIRQSMINRYMVIKLYPEYLEEYGSKMRAVKELSRNLPIHENGVYSILANHYFYFTKNKMKFP